MLYAIIQAGIVVETRDIGYLDPTTQIKKGADGLPMARPIRETRPSLLANQYYASFVDTIEPAEVLRVWTVGELVPVSPSALVTADLSNSTGLRALVRVLAQRFNLTEQQLVDEIKARAD